MTQKYFINLKKKDAKFELNKDNPYLSRFNYIIISKYHNSSILYTNENNKTKTTEEKLEVDQKGLDDIKEDSGYHDPIALNKLEYLNVPQDPKDFQLPNEWKSVVDGFNTDIGESSSSILRNGQFDLVRELISMLDSGSGHHGYVSSVISA